MSNITELEILKNFGKLIPMLSEEEKARFLAYTEGMAFMADKRIPQSSENKTET